jgi:stage IV sporulation protein FB
MIKLASFLYIHFLTLVLLALAWFTGTLHTTLTAYAVVLAHEAAHYFAARALGVRARSLAILPFGMSIRLESRLSRNPFKEILVALAGPCANALMGLTALALKRGGFFPHAGAALDFFLLLNAAHFALNLVPAAPLDGGRVLRAVLTLAVGFVKSVNFMKKLSVFFAVLLFLAGLWLIWFSRWNLSLVMAACFLFYSLAGERRANELLLMKEILYYKEKIKTNRAVPAKSFTVAGEPPARRGLSQLSHHTFCFFYVLDKKARLAKIIGEAQLIDSILEKGSHVRFDEVS